MNRLGFGLVLSALVHGFVIFYADSSHQVDPKFNVQSGHSSVDMVFSSAARASASPEKKEEKSKKTNKQEKDNKDKKTKSEKPEEPEQNKSVEKVAESTESDTAAEAKSSNTAFSKKKPKKTKKKESKQSAPRSVKHAGVKWVQDVDYRRNPPPRYPTRARVRHQEGVVRLLVRIDAEGHPEKIILEESSGHPLLDRAARNAVQRWRFKPAQNNGNPVASMTLVPVRFSLDR